MGGDSSKQSKDTVKTVKDNSRSGSLTQTTTTNSSESTTTSSSATAVKDIKMEKKIVEMTEIVRNQKSDSSIEAPEQTVTEPLQSSPLSSADGEQKPSAVETEGGPEADDDKTEQPLSEITEQTTGREQKLKQEEALEQPDTTEHKEQDTIEHEEQPHTTEHEEQPNTIKHEEQPDKTEREEQLGTTEHKEQQDTTENEEQPNTIKHEEQPDKKEHEEQPGTTEHKEQLDTIEHENEPEHEEQPDKTEHKEQPGTTENEEQPDTIENKEQPNTIKHEEQPGTSPTESEKQPDITERETAVEQPKNLRAEITEQTITDATKEQQQEHSAVEAATSLPLDGRDEEEPPAEGSDPSADETTTDQPVAVEEPGQSVATEATEQTAIEHPEEQTTNDAMTSEQKQTTVEPNGESQEEPRFPPQPTIKEEDQPPESQKKKSDVESLDQTHIRDVKSAGQEAESAVDDSTSDPPGESQSEGVLVNGGSSHPVDEPPPTRESNPETAPEVV